MLKKSLKNSTWSSSLDEITKWKRKQLSEPMQMVLLMQHTFVDNKCKMYRQLADQQAPKWSIKLHSKQCIICQILLQVPNCVNLSIPANVLAACSDTTTRSWQRSLMCTGRTTSARRDLHDDQQNLNLRNIFVSRNQTWMKSFKFQDKKGYYYSMIISLPVREFSRGQRSRIKSAVHMSRNRSWSWSFQVTNLIIIGYLAKSNRW